MRRHDIQDATGVITRDPVRGITHWVGAGAPTDSLPDFAPSCFYQRLDGSAGTQFYINEGTKVSSSWKAVATVASGTFVTATVTTLVNTAINASAAAATLTIKANTQHAYEITDGSTIIAELDTRNTIANVNSVTLTASNPTIASAAAAHQNSTLNLAAKTITYTGALTVTSSLGAGLYIGAPTFTDASAGTITSVSNVHIAAVAAAGGSLTITNSYMVTTGVSDCYLTNAGVWTDTACWKWGKLDVGQAASDAIYAVIDQLTPKRWKYRDDVHGNDRDRDRVGIVYDDLPDELRAPGQEKGVSAGLLASFCLAALRVLRDENSQLRERLERLETAR